MFFGVCDIGRGCFSDTVGTVWGIDCGWGVYVEQETYTTTMSGR